MTLGIMQPYAFPYIGYFQLINAVDKFVILDDVNFINKGWINRNNVLVSGKANIFTIPLKDTSQNKLINEIDIAADGKWETKLLKTLALNYRKAPMFDKAFPVIEETVNSGTGSIAAFNYRATMSIMQYLEIKTEVVPSSSVYQNRHLKGQERIIDICMAEQATVYINPIGGMDIYTREDFSKKNLDLHFIRSGDIRYDQFKNEFVPWLSIIDVMMFNQPEKINELLNQYELI